MGYLRRHAIIVTGDNWHDAKDLKDAHAKATELFPWVSPISAAHTNGEMSFFIPPDGSKEGWPESTAGDTRRDTFVAWLNQHGRVDCWVEVCYGEDEPNTRVTRASDL